MTLTFPPYVTLGQLAQAKQETAHLFDVKVPILKVRKP